LIEAILLNEATPILGASVDATAIVPDGTREALVLYDDGTHGDTAAGDGIYTTLYSDTQEPGDYTFEAQASGTVSGFPFMRATAELSTTVAVGQSSFTGTY